MPSNSAIISIYITAVQVVSLVSRSLIDKGVGIIEDSGSRISERQG